MGHNEEKGKKKKDREKRLSSEKKSQTKAQADNEGQVHLPVAYETVGNFTNSGWKAPT